MSELPDDQQAAIAMREDGTIVFFLRRDQITAAGAEALQAVLASARDVYHEVWDLPAVATAAFAS